MQRRFLQRKTLFYPKGIISLGWTTDDGMEENPYTVENIHEIVTAFVMVLII